MASRQHATSVTTSATSINGTQYPGWILVNNGSVTLYIGDSGVTTATGFPIPPGTPYSPREIAHQALKGQAGDRIYGIVASGTCDVRVFVEGAILT